MTYLFLGLRLGQDWQIRFMLSTRKCSTRRIWLTCEEKFQSCKYLSILLEVLLIDLQEELS